MSKKLLNESTVRRFMKLANIGPMGNGFINEMGVYKSDEPEGGLYEFEGDEELDLDVEEDLGAGDPELEAEDELGAEEASPEVEAAMAKFIEGGAAAIGVDVSIDASEEPEGDLPMEDEAMDLDAGENTVDDLDMEGEDMDDLAEGIMALLENANIQVVDDTARRKRFVNKVTARVARRLLKQYL